MTDDEKLFKVGQAVVAVGPYYTFEGHIVAVFHKYGPTHRLDGPVRYVVEDSRGLLLIRSHRTLKGRQ